MQEIWNKLVRFCGYQERCRDDVRKKLVDIGVKPEDHAKWIAKLEAERFLSEDRFVKQFVNGRFQNKKWGRKKIETELVRRGIKLADYAEVIRELIPEEDYTDKLAELATKKWKTLKGASVLERKQKLFRFLLSKGYESAAIAKTVQLVTVK